MILRDERARRLAGHGRLEGRPRERVVERAQARVREQHVVVERRVGDERRVAALGVVRGAGLLVDAPAEVRGAPGARAFGREDERAIERRARAVEVVALLELAERDPEERLGSHVPVRIRVRDRLEHRLGARGVALVLHEQGRPEPGVVGEPVLREQRLDLPEALEGLARRGARSRWRGRRNRGP